MNLKTLFSGVFVFLFLACQSTRKVNKNQNPEKEVSRTDRAHTSENSLDWAGTYHGVLPCADCPGIATKLVLNKDLTYTLTMDYQEREATYNESGNFKWNDKGNQISLYKNKEDPGLSYFVGENQLIQLDGEGHRIKGDIGKKFILKKTE